MTAVAIRIENLSKRYYIGQLHQRPDTLRDALASFLPRITRISRKRNHNPSNPSNPWQEKDPEIWALKDVSFEVKRGEVVGVIGRNGAGKSTLLKILSRITEPTSGRAEIHGRVGSLLEVGTGFHPELTGRENIYLSGSLLGMKRQEIDRRFDEIVDFSGVEKFIDTPIKRYSSGMNVRLGFAVAAHMDPEILLVDEVLAVGDVQFQKKCLGKMGDVARGGRTVLFVSHNMEAVGSLCNYAFYLDGGQIQKAGNTQEIIDFYLQTTQSLTKIPLRNRQDRSGNGRLRFTNVFVRYPGSEPIDIIRSGEPIEIIAEYETKDGRPVKNVNVSFSFSDIRSRFLFLLDNTISGYHFEEAPPSGQMICEIAKVPLSPGIYFFNVYARVNGILSDWVRPAAEIEVTTGDFYPSGRFPPPSHGGLLIEHIWHVEPKQ